MSKQPDHSSSTTFLMTGFFRAWQLWFIMAVAGTTAAGLRAGVPSIIVPRGSSWGQRLAGVGVSPPQCRTKASVGSAWQQPSRGTMNDKVMRERASSEKKESRAGRRWPCKAVEAFHRCRWRPYKPISLVWGLEKFNLLELGKRSAS